MIHTRPYRLVFLDRLVFLALALLLAALPLATAAGEDAAGAEEEARRHAYTFDFGDCGPGGDGCLGFFLGGRGGFLGLELTRLSEELRKHFGAPPESGVLIAKVLDDSPAQRAGLEVGDVIVAVDGEAVASTAQLGRIVRRAEEGDRLAIEVIRDGEALRLEATVVQRERVALDLGEITSGALAGVDWERFGEELPKAFEGMDFDAIAERGALSGEAVREALEGVEHLFESESWQRFMERVQEIDHEELEAKMKALRERLESLEQRLEARGEGDE